MHIEIIGKFFDNHSLSIVNRNLALGLKTKHSVSIISLDQPDPANLLDVDVIDQLLELSTENQIPDIQIRHSYPPIWNWPENENTRVVYIQPWEFSSIPSEWQYKFDTFADAVITPSEWTKKVYVNAGINPNKVFAIPNGYNPTIFNKGGDKDSTTRFLYVGCSQFRKGVDILLSAWSQATKNFQDLELVIKDNPQVYGTSSLFNDVVRLQYTTKCARIRYISDSLSEQELSALYKTCHYVVHPYRGEGFGMHIQEAMACGAHPIVTQGGPTDEFVVDTKIPASKRIVDMREIFAIKQGDSLSGMGSHRWVLEPSKEHLVNILKTSARNGKTVTTDCSKLHTWDKVIDLYSSALEQIITKRVRR